MFTECIIRFVDDDEEMYAIIKDSEYDEEADGKYDDMVFYYGLSTKDLVDAQESGEVIDEWMVVEVIGSFESLDSELYAE